MFVELNGFLNKQAGILLVVYFCHFSWRVELGPVSWSGNAGYRLICDINKQQDLGQAISVLQLLVSPSIKWQCLDMNTVFPPKVLTWSFHAALKPGEKRILQRGQFWWGTAPAEKDGSVSGEGGATGGQRLAAGKLWTLDVLWHSVMRLIFPSFVAPFLY